MNTRWLAAIIAFGCHSLRIVGNLVDQARLARRSGDFAIGIGADLGFRQLDVAENTVDRLSAETQRGRDQEPLADSIALLVEDLPEPRAAPMVVETETTRYYVTGTAIYGRAITGKSRSTTSVRGNKLNGAGAFPAVVIGLVNEKYDIDISRFGPLTFAENFCELDVQESPLGQPAAVTLAAQALVLPDNQVRQGWGDKAVAVRAKVPMLDDRRAAVTATGNITDGDIVVNGPVLQPPWQDLNIRLS
jgi:hypothetical protein